MPAATMERGPCESIKEPAHMEMTLDIEVDEAVPSTTHGQTEVKLEFNMKHIKEDAGLMQLIRSEAGLSMKQVVEVDWQDIGEQHCVQGASTPAAVGSASVSADSANAGDAPNIKEETADIDLNPTKVQHMDTYYRTYQTDLSVAKIVRRIYHDHNYHNLTSGVKEELDEEKCGDKDKKQCVQDASTSAANGSVSVSADSANLDDALHIKVEQTEIDVYPTELQHVNISCGTHQLNMSVAKQVSHQVIHQDQNDTSRVMEELVEDKNGDSSSKRVHGSEKRKHQGYRCDKCLKVFKFIGNRNVHIKHIHGTESHQCNQCNKEFKCKPYLSLHIQNTHSEGQYECNTCKKICKSRGALLTHVSRFHRTRSAESKDVNYPCDKCEKIFKSNKAMKSHCIYMHATGQYKCIQCNRTYKNMDNLRCHIYIVHGKKQYECNICKKMFKAKAALSRHNLKVKCDEIPDSSSKQKHGSKEHKHQGYRCNKCPKVFKHRSNLYQHKIQIHGTESHKCTQCNKEFKCKAYLSFHVKNIHSKRHYQCDFCKKMCKSQETLDAHISKFHCPRLGDSSSKQALGIEEQDYRCNKCPIVFKSKVYLNKHLNTVHGTKSHKCTQCNKEFKCKLYLSLHIQNTHSKELFKCDICKKMCKSRRALHTHISRLHRNSSAEFSSQQVHGGEELKHQGYRCNKCLKIFKSDDYRNQHMKQVHGTISHKCTQCDKEFKCKEYLSQHVKDTHSIGQYECDICKKMCRSRGVLRYHVLKSHRSNVAGSSSEQVFICTKCPKVFKSEDYRYQHIRLVHGTESHKCTQCNKKFKCKQYLSRHIKNMHSRGQCKCDVCKKMFKSRGALCTHVSKYHCKRSAVMYTCDYCQRTYSKKHYLIGHIANIHDEYFYECSECNKHFRTGYYLLIHMRKKHVEISQREHNSVSKVRRVHRIESPGAAANSSTVSRVDVTTCSADQGSGLTIKQESGDLDLEIGPTVIQHMDSIYGFDQVTVEYVKMESSPLMDEQTVKSETDLARQEDIGGV